MDGPRGYEIRVEEHLTGRWSGWFDGLALCHEGDGSTVLRGTLTDQAALFGVLARLHALNLTLVSVRRLPDPVQPGRG